MTAVRVAVLVSGGGTNLQSLLDATATPGAPARVTVAISNRADAGALERARRAGVATAVLADHTNAAEVLRAVNDADLVVLAGYLKLVPAEVVARFRCRMINIHPALLPAFGGPGFYGRRVHEAVLASGATVSGAIIAQWPVPVHAGDTPDTLAARVLAVEHHLLPAVVLALARLGVPEEPVRLVAAGEGFAMAQQPNVEIKTDATE